MRGMFQKYFLKFSHLPIGIIKELSTNEATYSAFAIEMYRHTLCHRSTA